MAISSIPGLPITGSSNDDILNGTVGNDTIDGGTGSDTMTGGKGDDTYTVDVTNIKIVGSVVTLLTTGDNIIEVAGGGNEDTVNSGVNYQLSNEVENIIATGSSATTLIGNSKDNVLDGSQAIGANILKGLSGNDTYFLGAGDTVVEAAGGGTDTIISALATDLSVTALAQVEDAIVTGSGLAITGNALANQLFGGAGANTMDGGAGNDVLDGGAAGDAMTGGLGDDTYYVDDSGDTITEGSIVGSGTDSVIVTATSGTFTLGANVENMTLSGTGNTNATGNASINIIKGNAGNNILDGGLGGDKLTGGFGDDTYNVDNAGDLVTEKAGQGTDTIVSTISITALALEVENLTLSGSIAVNGTGNAVANIITGNNKINILNGLAGNDTLSGLGGGDTLDGGKGDDAMTGGLGNDLYKVDSTLDTITEAAGAGTGLDSVEFTVTKATAALTAAATDVYTLATNVENITLMGTNGIGATVASLAATDKNTMTGNSGANSLTSGDGADRLFGMAGADILDAGAGDDFITGGAGKDTVITGTGSDTVIFAGGTVDTATTGSSIAGVDLYSDLDFASDTIDLTVLVANVDATAQTGAVSEGTFASNMSTLLNVAGGEGFDTDSAGITAAIVTATGGDLSGRSFLAVDLNGSNTFTATDFVIEITGSSLTGLTTDVFV